MVRVADQAGIVDVSFCLVSTDIRVEREWFSGHISSLLRR